MRKEFQKHGSIVEVNVPLKSDGNLNRGFGFVEFSTKEEAFAAIKMMNQQKWKGRTLAVEASVSKGAYQSKVDKIVEHTNLKREQAVLPKVLREEKKKEDVRKEELKE